MKLPRDTLTEGPLLEVSCLNSARLSSRLDTIWLPRLLKCVAMAAALLDSSSTCARPQEMHRGTAAQQT